ncbi:hypothetical protein LNQ81_12985 [Myroides sp. M-43]|uniref:hypothetical protein n=1 Tax=Myroides oncorhynchi TaxID=2893756 RepID=UPI001E2A918F|nr:hypothetical protein [Myroides oncorhynchi]MCC9043589.1 hypothetical protein [Myroides oncorhynchi]
MFANSFYRNYNYSADDNILVLFEKDKMSENVKLFITSLINKKIQNQFNYSKQFRIGSFNHVSIKLPMKNGVIDFDFMEHFIASLEQERTQTLQDYLQAIDLNNYELTKAELNILEDYGNIQWSTFKIKNLFERIKTKKLPYKAEELAKEATGKFTLPCLTSSFKNQGLNYFVPQEEATILKNVISIPSNSDVYRAYFQSKEFTVLSDAYAIKWIGSDYDLTPNQYLFAVQAINKVTDLPIYSYKNKLGGWNVVKEKSIQLPAKNSHPDFETMEILISAIKKLLIKDIITYIETM